MAKLLAVAAAALVVGFLAGWLVRGGRTQGRGGAAAAAEPSGGAEGGNVANGSPVAAGAASGAEAQAGGPGGRAGGASGGGAAAAEGDRLALDAATELTVRQAQQLAGLQDELARTRRQLAEAQRRAAGAEGDEEEGATAAERRAAAAREGDMLVEFPQWGDELGLPDDAAAKHGLSAGEREALDRLYADFTTRLTAELKRLYRELTGDPQAGEASTLNALLHDVIQLSPPGLCQARMAEALQRLAAGEPLPPPGPDAPPCETAIWFVFSNVDALEAAAAQLGLGSAEALWSGRSTFRFGSSRDRDD